MPTTMSVVLTHYRTPDVLMRALEAVYAGESGRLEDVVVVDGDPVEDLRTVLGTRFPLVRYVAVPTNVGFGALVNIGLRSTTSPYVLILNADVQVDAGCIQTLGDHLDAHAECGIAAPLLRNEDGSLQPSTFRFHRPSTIVRRRTPLGRTRAGQKEHERFLDADRRDAAIAAGRPIDVDWVLGAAMAVRRTAIDEVGPMDAAYFLYFEDVDWCLRFWRRGWRVTYVPTSTATHGHGRASARGGPFAFILNPLTRRHIRSAVRFFRLHGLRPERTMSEISPSGERTPTS